MALNNPELAAGVNHMLALIPDRVPDTFFDYSLKRSDHRDLPVDKTYLVFRKSFATLAGTKAEHEMLAYTLDFGAFDTDPALTPYAIYVMKPQADPAVNRRAVMAAIRRYLQVSHFAITVSAADYL